MINLIRNELIKISKKKSIYITLLVTLAFIIITNVIYNINSDNTYDVSAQIEFYEEQIKVYENNSEHKEEFMAYKAQLEIYKLMQRYGGGNTWQSQIIERQGHSIIYSMIEHQYNTKDMTQYNIAKAKYDDLVRRLDEGNWKYFAEESLKEVEDNLKEENEAKAKAVNKTEIAEIEDRIESLNIEKQILNWRLEKDICYGYDYYNTCLNRYQSGKEEIRNYEKGDHSNEPEEVQYSNKQEYYAALERVAVSQYDIEHGTHSGDTGSAQGILKNVFSEFEMFIIIMAVMIAGTIVSEEFNKGTVKLLLIKPYKRTTILAAKFITSIIMLVIVILLVILMQFVVGGVAQGFDTYSEPAVVYNHVTNQLEQMSLVKYIGIQAIGKLPIYVLLLTLAFALSTIFCNSALAIAITLLGSMSASTINIIAQQFKLEWIKFFVTPNWDLTQYFFGGLPEFRGLTMGFSIAIIIIYMVIMLVPTNIIFKKKNIKNI